ncbi:hypothetical protein NC653_010962 [Populus alba x Populus x berolinensis]|uniref:Uncharacterized protein n=1 Tax=Populus alba x Populus x berolinensis TaxID=444605 RepID=A0AAD6W6D0_9ROSI|nr:hypothetical protein NC653_010962 [Populus alba x Populus x berolinensis]
MSNSSEEHIQSDLYYTSKYEDVLLVMKGKISYYGTTILKLVRSIDVTSASIQLDSLASSAIFKSLDSNYVLFVSAYSLIMQASQVLNIR